MYKNLVKNENRAGWRGWNASTRRSFQIQEVEPRKFSDGRVIRFRASNGEPNGYIWAISLEEMDTKLDTKLDSHVVFYV